MATVVQKVVENGARNLVVEYHITSTAATELTATTVIVDYSALGNDNGGDYALKKYYSNLVGFSAAVFWDATTNTKMLDLIEGESGLDFMEVGGPITNNAGSGKTGDVVMTTNGIGNGDSGTIRFWFIKKS